MLHFSKWVLALTMLPNFVIIGAQKAGSSYLMRCLEAHPEVFMPLREIAYFEDPDFGEKSRAWFESHFDSAGGKQAIGFKRPTLLGRSECAARVSELIPRAKLIAILRNPVERAASAYFQLMRNGLVPVQGLEQGLNDILDGRLARSWPVSETVISWGLYHEHLCRFLKHFSREQIHVVVYDDLRAQRRRTVQQVYEFLGVDASFEPTDVADVANPSVYSLPRQRILGWLRPLHARRALDRSSVRQHSGPIGAGMRKLVKTVDYTVLARVFRAPRPDVSATLRQRLVVRFRDDMTALGRLLDRDLSHWLDP
jgi:hypothetical protein